MRPKKFFCIFSPLLYQLNCRQLRSFCLCLCPIPLPPFLNVLIACATPGSKTNSDGFEGLFMPAVSSNKFLLITPSLSMKTALFFMVSYFFLETKYNQMLQDYMKRFDMRGGFHRNNNACIAYFLHQAAIKSCKAYCHGLFAFCIFNCFYQICGPPGTSMDAYANNNISCMYHIFQLSFEYIVKAAVVCPCAYQRYVVVQAKSPEPFFALNNCCF